MDALWLSFVVAIASSLTQQTVGAANAGSLSIALCTPEQSACGQASDGNSSTCFSASKIQDNFYFAVFNTVGQLSKVSELKLLVGGSGRTKYIVSLASDSKAINLRCKDAKDSSLEANQHQGKHRLLDCLATEAGYTAGLPNVSSLMVNSEPLPIRLHLIEVMAFTKQRMPLSFAYCSTEEPGVCNRAIDGDLALNSPTVVSEPVASPYWLGGFNVSNSEPVAFVRIYRPDNRGATFFRVKSGVDCVKTGQSTTAGVEAIDYACQGEKVASPLLQVWEVDVDFLVNLCEIKVYGHEQ